MDINNEGLFGSLLTIIKIIILIFIGLPIIVTFLQFGLAVLLNLIPILVVLGLIAGAFDYLQNNYLIKFKIEHQLCCKMIFQIVIEVKK